LLVDANTVYPAVHRVFGASLEPGLTDALAADQKRDQGGAPVVSRRSENLDLLTAGSMHDSPGGTKPEAFSQFIASAKRDYRFVIVDLPALSTSSSAVTLAGTCDGVVLVAEADRVRWEVANTAKEQLSKSKVNILGVVVNKRQYPVPGWLYRTL
jgi:Mrp family chromosome partitioning ATPase